MIKQYKGNDITNVPMSKRRELYYGGIKYDGNYVQIAKIGDKVTFHTSGDKEFYLDDVAEDLVSLNPGVDFIIETEYIADTKGSFGSRVHCTTTTFRTNFNKNILCIAGNHKFKCFDILYLGGTYDCRRNKINFEDRLHLLNQLWLGNSVDIVEFEKRSLTEHIEAVKIVREQGWEGLFLFHPTHTWESKGRSNLAIKLKPRPTADLKCINVKYSDINPEDIGSVVLVDEKGRTCSAGGLPQELKKQLPSYFIGKTIEIEYEQIINTYVQPAFVCIREDK